MTSKKILGVGHPRTGTGYTERIMRLRGLDVGHEVMLEDGVCAWQYAPKPDHKPPFVPEHDLTKDAKRAIEEYCEDHNYDQLEERIFKI